MADTTVPVKPGAGAGPEAMAAYTKAVEAYTKAQEAKAKAADAAGKKIEAAPYTPVDTTGKPAAPITRVEPPAQAPYQDQLAGKSASTPFMAPPPAEPTFGENLLGAMKSGSMAGAMGGNYVQPPRDVVPPPPGIGAMGTGSGGIGDPGVSTTRADPTQRTGVENPKFYPQTISENPLAKAGVTPKKASTIDAMIAKLDAESKSGGPNIADFIEAAAAGWRGQKAAYLEKEAKKADVKADLEKLAKTATMEKELQDDRLAKEREIALLKLGGIPNLKPGLVLGDQFIKGLGG